MCSVEEKFLVERCDAGSLDDASTVTANSLTDTPVPIAEDDVKLAEKESEEEGKDKEDLNNTFPSDSFRKVKSTYHKNCFSTEEAPSKPFFKRNINDLGKSTDEFLTSLDAKLRNLKEKGEGMKGSKFPKKSNSMDGRPLFITTVKTGVFLEPPPELAALLGLNTTGSTGSSGSLKSGDDVLMYSFSSHPRVLNSKTYKKTNLPRTKNVNENPQPKTTVRAKRDLTNNNNNNTINNNKMIINNNNYRTTNIKERKPGVENIPFGNIMFDRRVVRGPVFTQHPIPTTDSESQAARQAEARRRAMARRKAQSQKARTLRLNPHPPAVCRKHEDVQTEDFLEELFDKPTEVSIATQTDIIERPPSPIFIPIQSGVDKATQIDLEEVFVFDNEVRPLIELLVGKTVEQSLIEVMEEDEVAAVREQQRAYKEIREAERAEEARLEEQVRRRRAEMEKRILDEEEAERLQQETEDRVAAAVLTVGYISDLLPTVVTSLKESGYIVDETKDAVEDNFMPWLLSEVRGEIEKMVANRELLSDMVREILETRAEIYKALGETEKKKIDDESDEDEVGISSFPEMEQSLSRESMKMSTISGSSRSSIPKSKSTE